MPNRILKESIWTSPTLARSSIAAQGFFIRLLPLPDDHGCFDARTPVLRGRLFPLNYADVTDSKIEKWMEELISVDCIRVWVHSDGVRYGYVPGWSKHQQIRSTHRRKTPEPPASVTATESSTTATDINCDQPESPDALNPNPNPSPPNPLLGRKTPEPPASVTATESSTTATDINCDQPESPDALNPNPNPNPNPPNPLLGFDEFWDSYPKVRRQGKAAAEKAWKKLEPAPDLQQTIIQSVMRKRAGPWKNKDPQYIPHPSTYLNGRRWEDEIETLERPSIVT